MTGMSTIGAVRVTSKIQSSFEDNNKGVNIMSIESTVRANPPSEVHVNFPVENGL